MNKFYEDERTLLNNIEYSKRLEDVKRKLAEQIQQEFSFGERTSQPAIIKKDKFSSHPRICSGSDTTISISPRNSSGTRANTMNSGISRKKTYKKWTNPTRPVSVSHQMDIDIGDTYENRSLNSFRVDEIKEELKIFYHKFQQKTPSSANPQSRGQESQKNPVVPREISEAVFEKKFKGFVEKSVQSISDIRDLIDKGIEPPDGDEDISRRMLRVKEFANRFSRNYLYPLVRQIDELSKWRSFSQGSYQKLLSAYQVIYNGLQAYQNHLPSSIGACSSDKLKVLMKHLLDICDIHYKLLPEGDDRSYKDFLITFRLNAEMTLKKIEDHFVNNYAGISAPIKVDKESKLPKQKKPKNNIQERLYMYNSTTSFRKEPLWRLAAEAFARDKNKNIKSRYKTAGFKHRPPIIRGKTDIGSVPESQTKLSNKKYFCIFKKQSTHTPFNEDEIATMIQMEDEKDKSDKSEGNGGEKQDENKQTVCSNSSSDYQKDIRYMRIENNRSNDATDNPMNCQKNVPTNFLIRT